MHCPCPPHQLPPPSPPLLRATVTRQRPGNLPRPGCASRHRAGGLTLVEVLAAIALVAVLAAMVTVPVVGARDRADMTARAAEAARLNAALLRLAAEGRHPPGGADAAAVAQFLRAGRAVDPAWRPRVHTASDRRARLIWTGTAFTPARIGTGLRPAGRDEDALPQPSWAVPVPTGANLVEGTPWIWAAVSDPGPVAPDTIPRTQPFLQLRRGLAIISGPVLVSQPGTVSFVFSSNPPGDLLLQVGDLIAQGQGTQVILQHPFAAGEERDLWAIGERHDPDPAARGRLAFPVHVRLTPTCTLALVPPPGPIEVPEDGTVLATLHWEARWSDGPVTNGTLSLPLHWSSPGGHEEEVPVQHQHAGRTAATTVIARHAPASAPLHWTARVRRGSLPWTGVAWQVISLSGAPTPASAFSPMTDPPGAMPGTEATIDFSTRLPAGSWQLTATLHDSAGPATTASLSVQVGP